MTCRCRHAADAHEHYSLGSYCSVCLCEAYQPRRSLLTRAIQALLGARGEQSALL